jgi:hypothetical protein
MSANPRAPALVRRTAGGFVGFSVFLAAVALINLATGFFGGSWLTVLLLLMAAGWLLQVRRFRRLWTRSSSADVPEELAARSLRSRSRVVTLWLSFLAGINALGWGSYIYFTTDLVTALLLVLLISVSSAAGILGAKLLGEALGRAALGAGTKSPT